MAGGRGAVPAVGARGRVRGRPPALRGRRCPLHRPRARLGAVQAANAERDALVHGVSDGDRRVVYVDEAMAIPAVRRYLERFLAPRRSRRSPRSPGIRLPTTPDRARAASRTRACATRSPASASTGRRSSRASSSRPSSGNSSSAARSTAQRSRSQAGRATSRRCRPPNARTTRTADRAAAFAAQVARRPSGVSRVRPGLHTPSPRERPIPRGVRRRERSSPRAARSVRWKGCSEATSSLRRCRRRPRCSLRSRTTRRPRAGRRRRSRPRAPSRIAAAAPCRSSAQPLRRDRLA